MCSPTSKRKTPHVRCCFNWINCGKLGSPRSKSCTRTSALRLLALSRVEEASRRTTMHYEFTAIHDADVLQAVEPIFQHVLQTYASEANKTVDVWGAVPDNLLDFKPHEKTNPIRTVWSTSFSLNAAFSP